ncbi:MAG: ribosomal RNA small subunit methyltransferase A [Candidatus Micrarchaeota archaeon]|nr:ribosomal RNA small subunit methyltransferase A [Candidatus Micrarchaeota archaeon]
MYLKPVKALGQHFLVNVAIAEMEAEHARGKNVIELGPGYGVLTRELCRRAKRVVAVELDRNLFTMLKGQFKERNLRLINKDFFEAGADELSLADTDIMIANVPYKLSSKTIEFLLDHRLQAVLCLQREFVRHMTAKPGTRNYSRLSVMFQLGFSHTKIVDVSRGSFRPAPRVDSVVIYIKPRGQTMGEGEKRVINALMQHKKKTVRNALVDSCSYLGAKPEEAREAADRTEEKDSRVFKLSPGELESLAKRISTGMSSMAPGPDRV